MSIQEIIELYNKDTTCEEMKGGGIRGYHLDLETIRKNREIAERELYSKNKIELVDFIKNNFFRESYYNNLK